MASREYVNHFLKSDLLTVHPLSPGGLSLLPNFQKRWLEGSQFLEGVCWKRGGDFFEQEEGGIAVVAQKINLKFKPKKNKPKYLSAINKNLNWQILTKNLVTFKR